jgi:hypothetical protein
MPVLFSKSGTPEVKELTLWADDYIAAVDTGILPPAAAERGFKTYVKEEDVKTILKFGDLDAYLDAVRENWYDSLAGLIKEYPGYFSSIEEVALWLRTTTWTSTYRDEVVIELAKAWAAEARIIQKAMSAPTVQVNGLDTIDEDEDASKKRREAHQKLLGKLRPLPLQYTYTVYHDKYSEGNDYSNRLTILEKNVSDIAAFYQVYNNFPWDKVKLRDTVHIFHQAVKPVWEDPANLDGGCWTFRVPKAKAQEFFHEIALLNVSNEVNYAVEEGKFILITILLTIH